MLISARRIGEPIVNPHDVELFFKDPGIGPSPPDEFGTLYLLRRDIKSCMDAKILWPGAMCIMAGIDLLGKCLDGKDSPREAGKRFCSFVEKYFYLAPSQAEALYQLRNSLLHSFGLISNARSANFRFQLRASGSQILIAPLPSNLFSVDLICLQDGFEKAVGDYHRDLIGDAELQKKFAAMFLVYGKTPIG
jgi:hypothetical protein